MRRTLLAGLVLFWAILLTLGSILPIPVKDALHTTADHAFEHPALHIGCFIVLSALGSWFARSLWQRLFNLIAVIGFGLALEILEVFYYHQKLEVRDVRLDTCGAVIGLAFYIGLRFWRPKAAPAASAPEPRFIDIPSHLRPASATAGDRGTPVTVASIPAESDRAAYRGCSHPEEQN